MTGEVLILLLTAVPLFILWLGALSEVAWRRRMPLLRRIGWIGVLVVVPLVSLAVYVVVRPSRSESLVSLRPSTRSAVGTEQAAALVLAAERHARGELDDAGYDAAIEADLAPARGGGATGGHR
jgi:uncharacterized membrane protein